MAKRKKATKRRAMSCPSPLADFQYRGSEWECCAKRLGKTHRVACHKVSAKTIARREGVSMKKRGFETAKAFVTRPRKKFKTPGEGGVRLFGLGAMKRRRRRRS